MKSKPGPYRWWRRAAWIVLALLIWSTGFFAWIVHFGGRDTARKSDVIIVLGAAVRKGEPSPAFAARIRHGVELWRAGLAPNILFTGGLTHDGAVAEADVARRIARSFGVPEDAIRTESHSRITWENFLETRTIMARDNLRTAILVSDPDHLFRASMMASDLGISHCTSPTPYSVFRSWSERTPFLLNELWHCHTHRFYRWTGQRPAP